jgi:hypothetical protein
VAEKTVIEQMSDEQVALERFWSGFIALAEKRGGSPLNKHEGCWYVALDEHWEVAANGHGQPTKCDRFRQHAGFAPTVPPFSIYVEFNGWPAGVIDPYGCSIAAGEAANIFTLVEAVERAL